MRCIVFLSSLYRRSRPLRRILVVAFTGLSLLSPRGLRAQAAIRATVSTVPTVGSLVRVTLLPDLRGRQLKRVATVLAISLDSLRLAWRAGDTASLSVVEMHRLEVGLGPRRPVVETMGIGALVGGAGLGALAALRYEDNGFFSRSDEAAAGALVGAAFGAAIGGVVGALRTTERWRTVYRSGERVSTAVTPMLGPMRGVQVRVAF